MSSSSAAGLPSWIMMDRFVFRRNDDDGSFPDEDAAPMRANSFTSLGDPFTVALLPAAPPAVSRLYERWPGQHECCSTNLVAAHRSLLLLRALSETTELATYPYRQDYFVFKAGTAAGASSRLERLPDPECMEPIVFRKGRGEVTRSRWFDLDTVGLVSGGGGGGGGGGGDDDEFAVVQLAKFVDIPDSSQKAVAESSELDSDPYWLSCRVAPGCKMGAEICVFRSRLSPSNDTGAGDDGVVADGRWEILTVPIKYREEEVSDLLGWSTDGAITFNDSVCWFDYHRGGIMSYTPPPLASPAGGEQGFISYVRLPVVDERPNNSLPSRYPLKKHRSLCVTGQPGGNEQLKFVDVVRSDGEYFGRLGEGGSFTITCHTFRPTDDDDEQMWRKDAVITSKELWRLDERTRLLPPRVVPTFPVVSAAEPHLVHFLVAERMERMDKISVVVIDVITRTVVSVFPYIQGDEDLEGKDADMVDFRRRMPWSFLPSRF